MQAHADELQVTDDQGVPFIRQQVSDGDTWCLRWNHSVTGNPVKDCFADRAGVMTLETSYLHDFSAGLGEVLGRGHLVSAGSDGYRIEDMDEPIEDNILPLRVGHLAVDHHLTVTGKADYAVSRMGGARRVTIRLIAQP